VRVGVQYLGGSLSPKVFAQAVEVAGFDSVWCGDHVAHYIDGVSTLGCFAGCTDEIQIGTNVLIAPLRSAVANAKAIATTARLAGDRFVTGIGVGGDFPAEIAAVGAEMRTRGAFTDEFLTLLPQLLGGEPVSFEGRWTQLENFVMEPAPEHLPPVWIGGRADAALRRTVRHGSGYLGYLLSVDGLAQRVAKLEQMAAEANSPRRPDVALNVIYVPGRTVEESLETFAASSVELSGLSPEIGRQVLLLGDDEACVARIEEYVAVGLQHLILGCLPGGEPELATFLSATRSLLPAAQALVIEREQAGLATPK